MSVTATVRVWHDSEGWGVLDSDATPGGCWVRYSNLAMPGYHTLSRVEHVELEWEVAQQDGYRYRAVRAWPKGTLPHEAPQHTVIDGSRAFESELTITWDDNRLTD